MLENEEVEQGEVVDAEYVAPAFEPFSLHKERARFAHLNIRAENHGDEKEAACDLKFEATFSNSILKKIKPGLLESFYEHDKQRDVEADFLRKLKHPMIGTLSYDLEIPRTVLRIHDAFNEADDVILGDGKTNKFKITMLDGGTVKLAFRCQFSQPDEDSIASLMRVYQQVVSISLQCKEEEAKPDNFEQVDLVTQAEHSEARKKAESLFAEAPAEDPLALTPETVVGLPVAEVESNVKPIKPRNKRTANGAAINAE